MRDQLSIAGNFLKIISKASDPPNRLEKNEQKTLVMKDLKIFKCP